jgi:probable rRNA maturation factor
MSRAAGRPRLSVAVQRAVECPWIPEKGAIRRWAAAAAGAERGGEVTVRIVGEAESAALNSTYRKKAGPTNVLAFPADAPVLPGDEEPAPLGDLVICAPVVELEAAAQRKAVTAHFAHLVVHGTLHLIGHDHEEEAAAKVMEDREREVLAGFGFEDPYG